MGGANSQLIWTVLKPGIAICSTLSLGLSFHDDRYSSIPPRSEEGLSSLHSPSRFLKRKRWSPTLPPFPPCHSLLLPPHSHGTLPTSLPFVSHYSQSQSLSRSLSLSSSFIEQILSNLHPNPTLLNKRRPSTKSCPRGGKS